MLGAWIGTQEGKCPAKKGDETIFLQDGNIIHFALKNKNYDLLKLLMARGLCPETQPLYFCKVSKKYDTPSPLAYCIAKDDKTALELFLTHSPSLREGEYKGRSPYQQSIYQGSIECFKTLLNQRYLEREEKRQLYWEICKYANDGVILNFLHIAKEYITPDEEFCEDAKKNADILGVLISREKPNGLREILKTYPVHLIILPKRHPLYSAAFYHREEMVNDLLSKGLTNFKDTGALLQNLAYEEPSNVAARVAAFAFQNTMKSFYLKNAILGSVRISEHKKKSCLI